MSQPRAALFEALETGTASKWRAGGPRGGARIAQVDGLLADLGASDLAGALSVVVEELAPDSVLVLEDELPLLAGGALVLEDEASPVLALDEPLLP